MKKILSTLTLLLTFGQGIWAQTSVTTDKELFNTVKTDGTVELNADIDINSVLIIEHTTTLNLNGHKIIRQGAESDKDNGWVVWVKSTGDLTIKDTGTGGTITGGYAYNGAGIYNEGTLRIEGGTISGNTVVDKSGSDGRGGGIYNASGAMLTITGGVITGNEAVGSAHGGAGIFNDGTLTMTGGSVTSNRSVNNGGGIKNYGTLNMQGSPVVSGNTGDNVWLGEGKVITCTGAFTGSANSIGVDMERVGTFTNGYGTSGTATSPFFASKAVNDIVSAGGENKLRIGYYECSWDAENKQVVHTQKHIDGDVIYMTGGDNANIGETGTDSWYFVESNINYSMRVWCYGDVHLILGDNAQMMIGHGLKVFGAGTPQNASLKIYSQSYGDAMGRLISHCDANDEAGIGSVASTKMGPVEFHGGYIEAEGDKYAAGIGGGKNANSDAITIYDGIIKATNGTGAAAIGGGYGGSAESITIYGGDVKAYAGTKSIYSDGAGIGGGERYNGGGSCGVINIWGGTVTAKGASGSAGIGSGRNTGNIGGEINIHGGTVYAYALNGGAAIGSAIDFESPNLTGGTIRISGGDVKAYGQKGGVGIGSFKGNCTIEITGGTVYAEGSCSFAYLDYHYYGTGIGGVKGYHTNGGSVTISGGDVTVVSPTGAINYAGTVTITGHKVKVGSDENSTTPVTAAEIVEACEKNVYAKLEVCTEHHYNFDDVNETSHSGACFYCGTVVAGEHEIPAGTGVCSICGYGSGTWSVSIIVPHLDEDGYCTYENGKPNYQATATTAFKNKEFYLPDCDYIPKGYVFAGWQEGTTTSSLEATAGTTLLQPGDAYTPTDNVDFTAHFLPLTIELADNSDNQSIIFQNEDKTAASVTLTGRTLYKDGSWNTLCLPFDVDNFTGTPLEDAMVKTLESATFDSTDGTLTLNFSEDLTSIEAGKPYIVKWGSTESTETTANTDIANPVFSGVTISSTTTNDAEGEAATFHGIYSPISIGSEGDNTMLYMGADNTLYYPNAAMNIGACRAYFQLADGLTCGNPSQGGDGINAFVLNFGEETNSIENSKLKIENEAGAWYDISGRKLSGKPTQKGIYINNGQKVVIK